jgi:hypothetical protein
MATQPKKVESYAVPGGLKGRLDEVPLPELLQHLRGSGSRGVLSLTAGGARKSLYLRGGLVVFATSNLPNDRLGELLLREGKITVDEYEASIQALSRGKRQGRALVEMGALSPKDLWDGVQLQIREVVYSLFEWEEGDFLFEESALPDQEKITVDLDIADLILVGSRRMAADGPVRARFPAGEATLERVVSGQPRGLEPYETHVLSLVNGQRTTYDVCQGSEIGELETLKVLYAFITAGIVRAHGGATTAFDTDFIPADESLAVLEQFNAKYRHIFNHMVEEVGPIAQSVLEKYLAGLREERKDVLGALKLRSDGTLDAAQVERNLSHLGEDERIGLLVDALNELLYAELLAVKRTLGAEHEAAVIKALQTPS